MSVLLASLADSAICFVPDLAEPLHGHSVTTTNRTILRDRVDLVGVDGGTQSRSAWLGGGRSYVTALSPLSGCTATGGGQSTEVKFRERKRHGTTLFDCHPHPKARERFACPRPGQNI
jgi:hypothetical protein